MATSLLLLLSVNMADAADYEIETVAEGLSFPWAMAFLPGGEILVTERSGQLRRISGGKLMPEPVKNIPQIYVEGQGGLMDILPDPGFADNARLFLSFSSGSSSDNALQVISAKYLNGELVNVQTIFKATPGKDTPHHFGGRLALMPDQTLLITVGEGFDYRKKAQTLDNHFGKVIRINKDGSIPADNPFVKDENVLPEIWTYGHRNPQGLLVSADGTVWLHEHGPRGGDELNNLRPGRNYGWPAITYGMDYSGAYVSPFTEAQGMEQPIVYWVPSIAPGGFCEYQGDVFPDWRGNLFVATLVERGVRRLVMNNGAVQSQETLFTELGQRIREVRAGPDGFLYLLTDSNEGSMLKVFPAEGQSGQDW
jgi:glucose/arabinose dehydrogenase